MTTNSGGRGGIGNQIFDEVESLVAGGMNKSQAFNDISARTGREAGTVAANYYRVARQRGAALRPRRRSGGGAGRTRAGSGDVAAALAKAQAALDDLSRAVRRQEQEIARMRDESRSLAELRRLAKRIR
jgi:chromosome segregation ATPase